MTKTIGDRHIAEELQGWFEQRGYVRLPDSKRRDRDGQKYKKGYEVRFSLDSTDSVAAVSRLLRAVGLRPGKPFQNNRRVILPVYGRASVEWFLMRLPKGQERSRRGFARDGRRLFVRVAPYARRKAP